MRAASLKQTRSRILRVVITAFVMRRRHHMLAPARRGMALIPEQGAARLQQTYEPFCETLAYVLGLRSIWGHHPGCQVMQGQLGRLAVRPSISEHAHGASVIPYHAQLREASS